MAVLTLSTFATYLIPGILFGVFVAVFIWTAKKIQFTRRVDKIPGPPYSSYFGHAPYFYCREERFKNFIELLKGYCGQPVARLWAGSQARAYLLNGSAAEILLSSYRHLDKDKAYDFMHPWLGLGLLTSTGSKWHGRRKMITPSFHFRILEEFLNVFNEQAQVLSNKLQLKVNKNCFNVYPYITLCTLDIICETAMGQGINAQLKSESVYVKAVYSASQVIIRRTGRPWLHSNFIFSLTEDGRLHKTNIKILHDFTNRIIRERRHEIEQKKHMKLVAGESQMIQQEAEVFGSKRRLAFLDMLLQSTENGHALSDEDIREEVDTFMFEGHDTTATGIAWTLYCIGRHPHVQRQLHEELDAVFGDSNRHVTSADLRELKYMDCAIKEALRMFPPVPFFSRVTKEDVKIGNHVLPAGTNIGINAYLLHRDPNVFPDPDRYDPERFFPRNSVGRHPYAYVPFSAGPRNCIGQKFALMEEKIVLSHIFRRFKVNSVHDLKDMKILSEMVLRPMDGIWVTVEERNACK